VIEEQRQCGRTVLLVSHLLTEVERVSDRVAVLVKGRLVHVGPVETFIRDPRTGAQQTLEEALGLLYEKEAA
jgi:ABC-2 type transport system ATP-binding protein